MKYVSGRAQTPWGVVAAGFLLVWLPLEPAFAKPRFRASEIQGKGSEILFCDLDGDRLEDVVLIDEPNLALFYQDARRGFARKPHQVCNLGDKPSVVWPAKADGKAESLLVMTSDGVTQLRFTGRGRPLAREQIIAQQTVVPQSAEGRSVVHLPLSAGTNGGAPLVFVPTDNGVQIWQHRDAWQHVQSLKHVLDTAIWPSVQNPGYTKRTELDMSLGDINADGRDDMVVRTRAAEMETYAVYPQGQDGLLAAEPVLTFQEKWDWRTWLCWMDINKDGRVDLIRNTWLHEPWFLPGTRSGKVLVRVYFGDEQGRIPPEPQQVFRKNDWIDAVPIVDLDGDGFMDLVLGYSAFDSREGVRKTITAKQLDFNLKFHFFRPGTGFSPKPDCQRDLLIHLDRHSMHLTYSRRWYFERFVNLSGDFDGDGDIDLLVRDRSDRVSVYSFVSRQAGFSKDAGTRFSYTERVDRFDVRDLNRDGISDLIMKLRKKEALRIFVSQAG